jgi:hypothetical protein
MQLHLGFSVSGSAGEYDRGRLEGNEDGNLPAESEAIPCVLSETSDYRSLTDEEIGRLADALMKYQKWQTATMELRRKQKYIRHRERTNHERAV